MANTAEIIELTPVAGGEPVAPTPSIDQIQEQLQKIIRSKTFQRAKRLRSLLEYVVNGAIQGQMNGQSKTAKELFGKSDDFDPSLDPVIRVQFGRLRRTLTNYYATEGASDQFVIQIPNRRYTPLFKSASQAAAPDGTITKSRGATSSRDDEAVTAPFSDRPMIAVLPFANLTSDPNQDAFCDGLTEEIAHGLASVATVDVVASSSASQFRHEPVDVREAGRELGVPLILEGSVRIEEGHTRVIAQLARSKDGVAVWSDSFEDEMNGSLNTQKNIAQKVMENLRIDGFDA